MGALLLLSATFDAAGLPISRQVSPFNGGGVMRSASLTEALVCVSWRSMAQGGILGPGTPSETQIWNDADDVNVTSQNRNGLCRMNAADREAGCE